MSTWGVTDELYQAIERGLQISADLKDTPHQAQFLAGLHVYRLCRFDSIGAITAARALSEIAETTPDTAIKTISEWSLGNAYHLDGNQTAALGHYQRGIELEMPNVRGLIDLFGVEHRARAIAGYARCLWTKGLPDQALRAASHGITDNVDQRSAVTFCHSALHLTQVGIWCGQPEEFEPLLDLAIAKTESQTMLFYKALALSVKGELLLSKNDVSVAVEFLSEANRIIQNYHYYMLEPQTAAALTHGLTRLSKYDDARQLIDETLSHVSIGRGYYWLPSLLRAKAEVSARLSHIDEAEELLNRSLRVAREQSAPGWELPAAIKMADLLHGRGRSSDALALVETALSKFPQGATSTDLKTGRELIAKLGGRSEPQLQGTTVLTVVPLSKPNTR